MARVRKPAALAQMMEQIAGVGVARGFFDPFDVDVMEAMMRLRRLHPGWRLRMLRVERALRTKSLDEVLALVVKASR